MVSTLYVPPTEITTTASIKIPFHWPNLVESLSLIDSQPIKPCFGVVLGNQTSFHHETSALWLLVIAQVQTWAV